jgi:hypothetical protein
LGLVRLRRALQRHGLGLQRESGFHSLESMGCSLLGKLAERCGRPDLADRLAASARLRYARTGHLAAWSTVALLIARREVA